LQYGQTYFKTICAFTRLGEPVSKKGTFSPPTLANWAASVEADETPTFIIPTWIPSDNLILLSGQPKDGRKTFFAMLTALVAANGASVGPLQCEKAVPVLYIYREGARQPTLQRFKALAYGHGLGPVSEMENLYFHHRGNFWLDHGDWVAEVCEFIVEHSIKLVYIDTFAKSCQSDENSSRDMGVAVQQAEKLRDAGATVVLVHHLKKGSPALSNGRSGFPEPDKDLRGSSALAGAYETHWAVRTYPQENSRVRETTMLVGGKEAEWQCFSYEWEFKNGVGRDGIEYLASVRLDMAESGELPHITGPREDRSKSSD
jgi:RecA-family ATPase